MKTFAALRDRHWTHSVFVAMRQMLMKRVWSFQSASRFKKARTVLVLVLFVFAATGAARVLLVPEPTRYEAFEALDPTLPGVSAEEAADILKVKNDIIFPGVAPGSRTNQHDYIDEEVAKGVDATACLNDFYNEEAAAAMWRISDEDVAAVVNLFAKLGKSGRITKAVAVFAEGLTGLVTATDAVTKDPYVPYLAEDHCPGTE